MNEKILKQILIRNAAYLDNILGGELGTRSENNLQLSMSGKKSINYS